MKRKYDPAELEIIVFSACDIITASAEGGGSGDGGNDKENNKGVFNGGYDPNGWT